MGKDPEVDPDAATVMPAGRREDAATGPGAKVVIVANGARIDAKLVSVSGREVVVHAAKNTLAVDAEVTLTTMGGKPASRATVVWTRSQGSSIAVGLALPDDGAARAWSALVG
jgi:hypothetical protein